MQGKIVVETDYLGFMFIKGFLNLQSVLLEIIIELIYLYSKCTDTYLTTRWKKKIRRVKARKVIYEFK